MIDSAAFQGKTAKFYTLGCKLNFSETSTFARTLYNMGVHEAKKSEVADIVLINTCSVTEVADHKCRQIINRMVRQNPGAFVIVTGCYAQLESETVANIEGVNLVLGSNEKANLVQYLSDAWNKVEEVATANGEENKKYHTVKTKDITTFQASCSRGNRTRYFLKVQDGCNYFCTYCTIPYARGFSRNPSIASLVKQAEEAVAEGGREIVLTGVNIGDFGRTTSESFLDLVKALDKVEGIERYRISSLEPDLIDDELIAYCATSKHFMPHFHIPLQSGSDEVLKLMHRHYDRALFANKINLIKEYMPNAFIGVDVMVGSRGEKPEYFEDCYNFLDALPVTQLHVFPYSERPGTSALSIPYVVDPREKKHRANRLLKLSDQKTQAFYAQHIGQEADILFEKAVRGKAMHGFTDNYIRVELSPAEAKDEYDNKIVRVRLGDFNFDKTALKAEII
ncbi:MAG: tRNA (N(6)-L-threonylcarbamoyladenosine(37)-C(2))-methylthiotransferase MtaB [Prevotella bivia]|uniref:tRNA (N(6)-L-threonylcarbamoyladenosine(37)-C(2))- methylthiotransferase MtaB n=1 Tax=Prevotella bivia TaxID=28125 RepID=UPI00255005A1|nr:tRNA (N(6)-L-threonylcarbamoyladenosine(37)-C(2))-methylthiotransferase MtaB [Prevotella bivia]MDU2114442.1 tRNA (N(6)-L-threonylcarbamoyladenosine(37)-C(2))-methylthiotransferase MtaB [Prevotella bivia]MDU2329313.1 tRNA (N(6)-L-threonylcarbamoyladenosine(37)-C(2))-methylthiotransferase MtaB [Prevotella bivia]MDZ3818549.1 tRNA (N(6)-L-threonylcarbamoyladenosine(37)-C(2))-methylthiotransferase MtaB [Prevotella bivia]